MGMRFGIEKMETEPLQRSKATLSEKFDAFWRGKEAIWERGEEPTTRGGVMRVPLFPSRT